MTARQLPLPFPCDPGYSPSELLTGPFNAEAMTWLARGVDWPEGRVCVWGEAGVGKTHLLHAWAQLEDGLVHQGADLCWTAALDAGRDIAVDRADTAPETELLHLLNAASHAGRRVLLAGRLAPGRWPAALPDLASRLRATLAVRVGVAQDDLLAPLFARLLAERQLAVPLSIQAWMLLRLPRVPAALAEAASRLDRAALAAGGRVTRSIAAETVDGLASIWHAVDG